MPTAAIGGTTATCGGSTNLSFSGTPNAIVTYSNGSTTNTVTLDGSGMASVPVSPATTTTYSATNVVSAAPASCAGTATGSAVVTVNTAPAFTTCTGNQTANTASNTCNAAVTYSTLPVVSGTPTPTLSYTFSGATMVSGAGTGSGATFNKGVTNVRITASNSCSPPTTCDFTVTVTDNQAPVIGSQGPTPVPAAILANVPEATQYRTVYQLNIPTSANYNNTAVPYTVDNSASFSSATFNRVAYYMELVSGSATKWVWVSMDKFNSTVLPSELGIPVNSIFQQNVSNMNVLSSSNSGITNGAGITTGNIEFWPQCYSATSSALSPAGASGAYYDFGDTRTAGTKCYGSFQVHNYGAAQTLFAYNRWTGGGNADLGIGTSPGPYKGTNNPDWTFNQNAGGYTAKKLYVFIDSGLPPISANTDAGQCSQQLPSLRLPRQIIAGRRP